MAQDWNVLSTSNVIRDDVARHNANYASLKSSFSGTSFPASPTNGQLCWRTDRGLAVVGGGYTGKMYKYTGNTALGEGGWITEEETSILIAEIENARGSKLTLDQRLDIALNEDGTLKSSVTAYQSEWVLASVTFGFVDGSTFTTTGNTTDIFLETRRVKVNLGIDALYGEVVSSSYNSGTDETTVVTDLTTIDNTLVSVEHGIISPYRGALGGSLSPDATGVTISPTIQTNAITNIAGTSFTANGQITDFRGTTDKTTVQLRFTWGTDTLGTNEGATDWTTWSDLTEFSQVVSPLTISTVYYVNMELRDTNSPSVSAKGTPVSATTLTETVDSDSYIYLQATGGTGYSALNATTVPTVDNGSIVSNEVVLTASGSATTYSIDQQGGQGDFSAITPAFKVRPYKFGIDSTSTNTTPVLTAGYSGLLTNGSKVIVDDGGVDKELTITSVSESASSSTITVSSTTEAGAGYEAWRLFDATLTSSNGAPNTIWDIVATSGYIKVDFGQATLINGYSLTRRSDRTDTSPNNWTFEGSNDNTNWTVLDTRTAQATVISGASGGTTYTFTNVVSYRYYRLNISTNGGHTETQLAQMTLNRDGINQIPTLTGYTGTYTGNRKYTISSFTPSLSNNPSSAYTDTNSTAIYASATAGAGKKFTVDGSSTTTSVVLTYASASALANGDTISMNSGTSSANQNVTFASIVQSGSGPYTYTCTSPSPSLVQVPTTAVKGSLVVPTLSNFTRDTDTLTYSYVKTSLPSGCRSVAQRVYGGTADVIPTIGLTELFA